MARTVVVGMHEAKTHFSRLVRRAQAGDDIVVENAGTPVARIVPYDVAVRKPGRMAGQIEIHPDFDDLPPGFEDFAE